MTKHVGVHGQLCTQSHYAAIVEAHKDIEVYQLGDLDCPDCLRRMAEKHEVLASMFRTKLIKSRIATERVAAEHKLQSVKRCRVYDEVCLNPNYCDEHDACCAGDPNLKELP